MRLIPFLATICRNFVKYWTSVWGARMAHITYQIYLYMNSLVFDTEIMPAHQVFIKALLLATEYYCFNIASSSIDALASWNSCAASTVS